MEEENYNLDNLSIIENRKLIRQLNTKEKNLLVYIDNLQKLLKIFGYKDLRPSQKDPIFHLFNGQDLLFVTPTSSGKSFCYIAPALCMGLKTVVFFPLVSLIQDQAYQLRLKGCNVGEITSNVSQKETQQALIDWENGLLDFLFIAPERLNSPNFMELMEKVPPDFVVVDEIHSASEYGENFRSSYKLIAPFIKKVCPKLFLGQTATMSQDVEKDVREIFDLHDTPKMVRAYSRPNLLYSIAPEMQNGYDDYIFREINAYPLVPTIVYCSSISKVKSLYATYGSSIIGGAMMYYGELKPSEKESNQQNFITGNVRVAFATNAFGMGINKADIGKVIFASFPGSIEELTQCFGRGGRNGCECKCILCPDEFSLRIQRNFIESGFPDEYCFQQTYKTLKNAQDSISGLVTLTISDIADIIGYDVRSVAAVCEFFKGYGIIQRMSKSNKAKIRYLDCPSKEEQDKLYEKFLKYRDKIDFLGVENEEDRCIDIEIDFLAQELGVGEETVKKNLKNFSDLGFIYYKKPFNSMPIKIIKSYSDFDYNKVIEKRNKKLEKLNSVIEYSLLPKNKLGNFLEDYYIKVQNG